MLLYDRSVIRVARSEITHSSKHEDIYIRVEIGSKLLSSLILLGKQGPTK